MKSKVTANSESVAGLNTRMDTLDTQLANLKVPWVDAVKEEEMTVNGELHPDFMAGQQRILDNIARRNQAMNQNESDLEIHGGPLRQEDKVVKLWEVARVDAKKDSIPNFFEAGLSVTQIITGQGSQL